MKKKLIIYALLVSVMVGIASDKPSDLTGASAELFKTHIGKVVSLCGRLELGKQGPCLFGATPSNVVFYVIPDMPASGRYTFPASWERLMHRQARLTGELHFRSFDRAQKSPFVQIPPDYYYMVLQRTQIESGEKK